MTSSQGLSQNVVNRVLARRLGTLDKGSPKTNFFDFTWFDAVIGNVLNSIFRPDEPIDCPSAILGEEIGMSQRVRRTAQGFSRRERESPFGRAPFLRARGGRLQALGADTLCKPAKGNQDGERNRRPCFLFADLRVVRFFSVEEIFVS